MEWTKWTELTRKALLDYVEKLEKDNCKLRIELEESKMTPIDKAMKGCLGGTLKRLEEEMYVSPIDYDVEKEAMKSIVNWNMPQMGVSLNLKTPAEKIRAKAKTMRARKK